MEGAMTAVRVTATAYRVSVWPESARCMDAAIWCLAVRDVGFGNWLVARGDMSTDGPVLGRDWLWHYENLPSARSREEIAAHRFGFDDAMGRAREMAPRVEVQGLAAAEAVARHEARLPCPGCEGPYTAG